ncbi:unnamed protein product [Cylicocyclus nassatus]|uniref:Uncharacterized protein n=1 Tax=Cylicocyclus nassatus TaxID=53992 RepID=A0AA36GDC2_CYLNA|nr:unnamed protein product [Cylicocyclus nassatus]
MEQSLAELAKVSKLCLQAQCIDRLLKKMAAKAGECIWFQKDDGPVSLSARTLRIQVFTSKAVRKSCIFDVVESYGKTRSTLLLLLRLRNSRCALSIVAMLALLNF